MEELNSKKLAEHLWDQMKKLNAKVVTVDEAKGQAALAKQVNNVYKYELDRARFVQKHGRDDIREIDNLDEKQN